MDARWAREYEALVMVMDTMGDGTGRALAVSPVYESELASSLYSKKVAIDIAGFSRRFDEAQFHALELKCTPPSVF